MHTRGLTTFLLSAILITISTISFAQQAPPDSISFQGHVTDLAGVPYDTTVSLTTKLYKDGVEVYSQVHAATPINGGVFNVIIGPLDTLAFDRTVYLGVTIGGDAEIVPRTPLTLVPYAQSLQAMRVFPVPPEEGYVSAPNIIGGIRENSVSAGIVGATISGGGSYHPSEPQMNTVEGHYGTIGGGLENVASYEATVGGGQANTASGQFATVSGGNQNVASGYRSSIGGGQGNQTGIRATVAGGSSNMATGQASMIPGGASNKATKGYSFAAGYRAEANHSGTFVWADSASNNGMPAFSSTGDNQFIIRARGGVGINTNSTALSSLTVDGITRLDTLNFEAARLAYNLGIPGLEIDAIRVAPKDDDASDLGTASHRWQTVYAGDGVINTSDAKAKMNIEGLSYGLDAVLDLRPVSFLWKNHPDKGQRFGLIAQEVAGTLPELVRSDGEALLGMNYSEVIPVLVKAIQEQQAEIERMKAVMRQAGLE